MTRRDTSITRRPTAGFVFAQLLVVIAIIAILIGLLLPAVQKVRESANNGKAAAILYNVCQAARTYDLQDGVYPSALTQFASLINDPVLVLTGMEEGFRFTITEASSTTWKAQADPVVVGVTGSAGFVVDQSCAEQEVSIPGADTQRALMFTQILAFGAETIAGLISSNPDLASQVRSFAEAPSTVPMAFQTLSAQSDSGARFSFSSIRQLGTSPDPFGRFLAFSSQAMHLGAGNENIDALPGVLLTELSGQSKSGVLTSQGVCGLTQIYESNPAVTHSLCAELSIAQAAEQQGNVQAKATALNAFVNELGMQTGKTLTQQQAGVLMTLVKTL